MRIKQLGCHNTYLQDGKTSAAHWTAQFWSIGDAVLKDLNDCYVLASKPALSKEQLKLELMVQAAEESQTIAAMLSGSFDVLAEMTEEQRKRIKQALKR